MFGCISPDNWEVRRNRGLTTATRSRFLVANHITAF